MKAHRFPALAAPIKGRICVLTSKKDEKHIIVFT